MTGSLLLFKPLALATTQPLAQKTVADIDVTAGRAGFLPLLILNSCLAYCQNLSNFLVTKHTSALTLQARALTPVLPCPDPDTPNAAEQPPQGSQASNMSVSNAR